MYLISWDPVNEHTTGGTPKYGNGKGLSGRRMNQGAPNWGPGQVRTSLLLISQPVWRRKTKRDFLGALKVGKGNRSQVRSWHSMVLAEGNEG